MSPTAANVWCFSMAWICSHWLDNPTPLETGNVSCPYPGSEQCGHNALQVIECYNNKKYYKKQVKMAFMVFTAAICWKHRFLQSVSSTLCIQHLDYIWLHLKWPKPPAFQSISSINKRFPFIGTIWSCGWKYLVIEICYIYEIVQNINTRSRWKK